MKPPSIRRAFTLVELLVVIVIIAVLAAIIFPISQAAMDHARKLACLSNLRQIGAGLALYAADNEGRIPAGPKAPPFTSPADLYPSTGAPTSLLSLRNGAPVGLGLLLDKYLAKTPKVLFCPGCDQPQDADVELARVGKTQAQGSYYYRHAGNTQLFDNPGATVPEIRLANLGENRNGIPIRALVIDTIFLSPGGLESFNVKTRTFHRQKFANILFADGHAVSCSNADGRYAVDVGDYAQLRSAFDKILKVLEQADVEP